MKNKTYSTDINLAELTGKIAQVRGGLDFMANNLGGLCGKEQADATLAKANKRLEEVQETLYDVMYTDK
jgi:hypothetical protein